MRHLRERPPKPQEESTNTPAPKLTFEHLNGLEIVYRSPSTLKRNLRSARKPSHRQIGKLAQAIKAFGWINPIICDEHGNVIAGNIRLAAAELLGTTEVPTILIDHLNEAEKRAYVLADNKLAELGGWDPAMLKIELGELADLDLKGALTFDLNVIGFETPEIDIILDQESTQSAMTAADATLEGAEPGPAVTQPGDLWILGRHNILCADALEPNSYTRLMGDDRVRVCFCDPPYNVPIDGHVCGLGKVRHREFAMASGEMSKAEFTTFLITVLRNMAQASIDGALLYICMDWRHLQELLAAGEAAGLALKNICCWVKPNAGMGSLYRSQHEFVCVFKSGKASHVNNIELGKHGRYRTNVWEYAGANSFRKGRIEDLAAHPTVKPTALVADVIKDCSHRGEIVLDPFAGSGTTILAAEKTGRLARAMELDPQYVDVAIRRWQALTGGEAIHASTGEAFATREEAASHPAESSDRAEGEDL
jgi:DNA modification methylase